MQKKYQLLGLMLSTLAMMQEACAISKKSTVEWVLVNQETFDKPFNSDNFDWVIDPLDAKSPWAIDQFDDNGEVWKVISNPDFSKNIQALSIYRKSIPFGDNNWLTAELAYLEHQDKVLLKPKVSTFLLNNDYGLKLDVPRWNGGAIIRPSNPLPAQYRIEMRLRLINFGGKRNNQVEYDDKYNGYTRSDECKTSYPWTARGALLDKERCDYPKVDKENGFYYLTILDHANPAPHGNPGIHYRRKIVLDGYYSFQPWSKNSAICNPKTKELYPLFDSSHNVVNAIFILGDRFRNFSNGYLFKTNCGDFEDMDADGKPNRYAQFDGIVSSAELQPELLPEKSYLFAVERHLDRYVIEMTGDFKHVGETTLRAEHKFTEDNKPIWHYNQTADEYDGRYDKSLLHLGPNGQYVTEHTWKKGSAYPDSFIIGDPHLNYYEGDAVIDDIKLYIPKK